MAMTDEEIRLRVFEAIMKKDGLGNFLPMAALQASVLADFIITGEVPTAAVFDQKAQLAGFDITPSQPPAAPETMN